VKTKIAKHTKPSTTKVRSKNLTCQKLMDAGLKIFCKHGYDAATTKLVAKESGVNEALINRYFKGKKGLLHAIIETIAKEYVSKVEFYPKGETAEQEIYNFCSTRLEAIATNPEFFKLMISRSLIESETKSKMNATFKSTTHDGAPQILVDRLTELQKNGSIRPDINIHRTTVAISMLAGGTSFFSFLQGDLNKETVLKIFKDFSRDYAKGLISK
jgi:AcrR family transcriptional regulator